MIHAEIPSAADIRALLDARDDICVAIYMRTTPLTNDAHAERTEFKNHAKEAIRQAEAAGHEKRRVVALAEHLDDLLDDDEFWLSLAHSLAVFATPENLRTFRVANKLEPMVMVSDRFHVKPLLRSVTFPNAAYVLALAEASVHLIEMYPDLPAALVKVEGMPKSAGSAAGKSGVNDRSPSGRLVGSEGEKVLLRAYARKVDAALRGLLHGGTLPLILASTEPLLSIYRSVNTYPHLAAGTIEGNPESMSPDELAARGRTILDAVYRDEIAAWTERFNEHASHGRSTTDLSDAARAATFGAVDSMLVNIDDTAEGRIDETSGAITFADGADAEHYGIVDEIAARAIVSGAKVMGVRAGDIPGGKPLAALLRYPV